MIADLMGEVGAASEPHGGSEAARPADPVWERDQLLGLSGELITMFDTSGRILSVNPAVSRSLGWNDEELQRGLNWVDLVHPDDFQRSLGLLDRILLGMPVRGHEARVRHRDGGFRLLSSNITPFLERGVIWCVSRDLTEYRAALVTARAGDQRFHDAEAAKREYDGLRDVFIRIVSHDLQNPLVAIAGLADLLAVPDAVRDRAEAAYLAGRIGSQARRLQRMVGSLLSLDRLYHGEEAIESAPTALADLVARVVDTVDLEGRPLSVDADDVVAWIDPEHVERIVENLLTNVCGHTPRNTPVRVRVTAEGDDAVIIVEDDGPGVPEEMRESLFELFRTGRADTRRGGVGLWIVRRLAVLHGGWASVEPGPNGGAAFRVWFPRREMAGD